jgi:hypothetical protein
MPKPLKRYTALRPLSRQHHTVLQCCFKLRQGLTKRVEADRILKYVHYFWQDFYIKHTKIQLAALFNMLSKKEFDLYTQKEDALVVLYQSLQPEAKDLLVFEKELYNHVRWEERVLFERIQEKFTPEQLDQIIPEKNNLSAWCELYGDQFWV